MFLFVCGFFIFNISFLKARTFFGIHTLPIQIFGGILINITRGWNRGIGVRNAIPMGMRSACFDNAVVGHAISSGKSEIAGIEVCPFLPVIS